MLVFIRTSRARPPKGTATYRLLQVNGLRAMDITGRLRPGKPLEPRAEWHRGLLGIRLRIEDVPDIASDFAGSEPYMIVD